MIEEDDEGILTERMMPLCRGERWAAALLLALPRRIMPVIAVVGGGLLLHGMLAPESDATGAGFTVVGALLLCLGSAFILMAETEDLRHLQRFRRSARPITRREFERLAAWFRKDTDARFVTESYGRREFLVTLKPMMSPYWVILEWREGHLEFAVAPQNLLSSKFFARHSGKLRRKIMALVAEVESEREQRGDDRP